MTRSPSSATRRVSTSSRDSAARRHWPIPQPLSSLHQHGISNTACPHHRRQPGHWSRNRASFREALLPMYPDLTFERQSRNRSFKPHTRRLRSTTPIHLRLHHISRFLEHHEFQEPWPSQGGRLLKNGRLVNCAGITQSRLFTTTPAEDIQDIVETNLTALMLGTRFLLRNKYLNSTTKSRADAGSQYTPSIINVSSLLGVSAGHGAVAYAASKAGVLGFTRALAAEYVQHGVRVNAIVPGYVESDMTKGMGAQFN